MLLLLATISCRLLRPWICKDWTTAQVSPFKQRSGNASVFFHPWGNGGPQSMAELQAWEQGQASGCARDSRNMKQKKSYADVVRANIGHHVPTGDNAIPVSAGDTLFTEMDYQENEQEALERILSDAGVEPIMLSFAFLRKITNDFSQEIGRGGFGVVYMGFIGRSGKVAVKKLSKTDEVSEGQFKDELKCLIRVKHKNIVRLLGYCWETQEKVVKFNGMYVLADVRRRFLCFEYVPNGSLHDYIKDKFHGREWDTCYQIIEGICHGLYYLHNEECISHLDLKPENILLDADKVPKITDFGLSRHFGIGQSRIITETIRGTLGYTAPEYLDKGELSFKSDIFSLGITILKLLKGSTDPPDLQSWHQSLDLDCPQVKTCIKIALLCVDNDQRKRPTIRNIIEMLNGKETMIEMVSTVNGNSRNNSGPSIKKAKSVNDAHSMDIYVAPLPQRITTEANSSASDLVDDQVQSMSLLAAPSPLQRVTVVPKGSGETGTQIRSLGSTEISKLLDVHPLELRFPFEPYKLIERPMTLTNRTDHPVGFWIIPTNPDTSSHIHFQSYFLWRGPSCCFQIMEPNSTWGAVMTMKQCEPPPWDTCKFEVLMIVMSSEEPLKHLEEYLTSRKLNMDSSLVKRVEELGGEVHRAMVKAVICDPEAVLHNQKFKPPMLDFRHIRYVDVHPTEPWILMAQDGGHVSIWNYQTQERVMKLEVTRVHTPATLSRWARGSTSDHWWFVFCPKFIAREQWFAAGDTDGWVRVYSYTTMDKVMEFKAHDEPVCLLCVHPTRPLLLTATYNDEWIKLWDWSKNRKFENKFNTQRHGSERLMWHPRDTNIFASVSTSNVKVWEIRSSHPTATLKGAKKGCYLYTESNRHLMVTLTSDWRTSEKDTSQIWDLQTEECVHKLGLSGSGIIDDIACHPTLPILATRGTARTVCLWDARPTYRLQKIIRLKDTVKGMEFIGTENSTRLFVFLDREVTIVKIDLGTVRTNT
ncbi:hypothetical protein GQ55_7G104100 [Panicum hallii var. hallii]|uniref:Protein kinase domain-containing protein n=1 Tax=Panicum hallii var. hallii TaxID=1504633 RepID=A0A2T7CTN6_9POAL|nr:hypothetical protein GQ55_7G104100 [Panicum hallii var. hallii]